MSSRIILSALALGAVVVGGTLLLSGAGLLALRRRPRVTTPGSPV